MIHDAYPNELRQECLKLALMYNTPADYAVTQAEIWMNYILYGPTRPQAVPTFP